VGGLVRDLPGLRKALLPLVFGIPPAPSSRFTISLDLQFPFGNGIHGKILLLSLSGHDTNQPKFRYNNVNLRIC
jgi:hypothetical protein